jgi:hypothetical protein
VKRDIWKGQIQESYCPPYPCAACSGGILKLVAKSFKSRETARSKAWRSHSDWDPDWLDYVFSAEAECGNPKCSQTYFLIGTGGVEPYFDDEEGQSWGDAYYPKACVPMPPIIEIPNKCPQDVKLDLIKSFEDFWRNPNASANAIRTALDRLMDHLGITKLDKSKKELTLHKRIEIYAAGEPTIGSQLMALKWLGNTGSHGNRTSIDDLLDAYEILEHCLMEVIEMKTQKIAELAAKLNKKHSPKEK